MDSEKKKEIKITQKSARYIRTEIGLILMIWFLVFNATFSNISAISWRLVLVVEEAGENHRPWVSN